jgi:hypothetical protein
MFMQAFIKCGRRLHQENGYVKFFQETSSHRMGQSPGLRAPLKEFHILIGNCELPVTVQMTILISKMVNDQNKFSFTDTGELAEFIVLSEAGSYDLFILVFNNLRWSGVGSLNDKAIEVIERIRSRGNAGAIALSCWWKETEFPDKVHRAGANFLPALRNP